ncbi:group II intron reverse transcriptase/maturase [Sinorhizobium meliloti]|uniref:group II intron reverse transcriptase/maturase n=1 Tax=Rhizobium meliloti TaxID=382 RepID=UPI00299E2401|nr:group II intron reverse transcriptase/maturase [Sinorhizobium meliloti]MDW9974457.1 group II intron reverse transcriptase/maturase [Sinorhizobium meliloti]MDW9980430.1 group II intron reverse transcriptase/maturase [Sinorhizobium meliloti]MDX0297086.1 group II intron reverse transcriptase/maturase [Sinorhizobium meliloti]
MTSESTTDKPFRIEKRRVYEAYKAVKANRGAAGVDGQTLEIFEKDLAANLYKIWNRMSSGTYFPPPVRAVSIPKKAGGERVLGVPTVSDRIAQMVVKQMIEPDLDSLFLPDSYGYRPGKSALDAVGVTRQRCWKYDWVLEFDIKGLFDNLPHDLLLKAVRKDVKCNWALLYIERWLTAPMEKNGEVIERSRGTPQGGVVSPILANLFLHYAFDLWMTRTHPDLPWCRYADDGLVHCQSEQQAEALRVELSSRLAACGLQMHPTKTKIVYCKDQRRREAYPNVTFDFLGYQFRPRRVANTQRDEFFCGYTPAVSPTALKSMRATIKSLNIPRQTPGTLAEIAKQLNPLLRGWIAYYGRYSRSALSTLADYVNQKLRGWIRRKFKRFQSHKTRASLFLRKLARENPGLFVHWKAFGTNTFT